jgi:hypothetical protein
MVEAEAGARARNLEQARARAAQKSTGTETMDEKLTLYLANVFLAFHLVRCFQRH